MKIDFEGRQGNIYSSEEIKYIITRLKEASNKGFITPRKENNRHLMAFYKGVENRGISPKWNIKIYSYNLRKGGHSIVCVDKLILIELVKGEYEYFTPPNLPIIRIDDAGWGFPLCGVMVGVTDEKEVKTAVVPIEFFRHDTRFHFGTKHYLKIYTELGVKLVKAFQATPTTHRIEICTGCVNQPLREKLRKIGYDVRVVEIKGMLQNTLEEKFKQYILKELGEDIYYNPKEIRKEEISRRYYNCLNFGLRNCPDKIKTGWNSIIPAGIQ